MKVAIVGAAGVRTPQLVNALLLYGEELGLQEIRLMDIDGRRLEWMGLVVQELNRWAARPVELCFTVEAREALSGVDYAFFTIRVGGVEARLADEVIPLKYGVLGQETTGPGGFAMALRTVPVMVKYLEILSEHSPGAWAINLTNPAGLITQALMDRGFHRVVGICDSPAELFEEIAQAIGIEESRLWFDYFGLNHLGWIKRVVYQGRDLLPGILADERALLRHGREMIPASLIRVLGVIPNEYLMFYYRSQEIVERLRAGGLTRARVIDELNRRLFSQLAELAKDQDGQRKALDVYRTYARARDASYMQLETDRLETGQLEPDGRSLIDQLWDAASSATRDAAETDDASEPRGYSGIALRVLRGLSGVAPGVIIVNTLNGSALSCLDPTDVVEIPAFVDSSGIHPFRVEDPIPEHCRALLQAVKGYERIAARAALEQSYELALQGLIVHPLVPDALVAKQILDDLVAAHRAYLGDGLVSKLTPRGGCGG
jgi:Alpha-galactosidases/6-phospho-beta-glucosidases, family 4 of glycosyl hydrolases